MKLYKRIVAWAIVSIMLQISGLFILDNFVFKHSSKFKSNKIDIEKQNTKDVNVVIPNDAENINISYNGKYLTYYENNILYIQESKNGAKIRVKTEDNGEIFKWKRQVAEPIIQYDYRFIDQTHSLCLSLYTYVYTYIRVYTHICVYMCMCVYMLRKSLKSYTTNL